MKEQDRQRLTEAGIDVDDMLDRFMGMESMAMKFLRRFPQDPSFPALLEALERGDARAAFEAAHTLKGVAGNLSIKPLLEQSAIVTDCLRQGDLDAAAKEMPLLEERYRRTTALLEGLDS